MTAFDNSFLKLHGIEGNYSTDRSDPGNWTKGQVGEGIFKGTKYGISAKSYPDLDIINLTLDDAKVIAKRDYWDACHGDYLPPEFADALFDMAFNQGVVTAVKLFQKALGVTSDGVMGPVTLAAFITCNRKMVAKNFTTLRIIRYSMSLGWVTDAKGWVGRALDAYVEMVI